MNTSAGISFDSSRRTLTAWYVLILLVVIAVFSFAMYASELSSFRKVILKRDFGTATPVYIPLAERKVIALQVRTLQDSTLKSILIIDGIVILLIGSLSYILAGKTMKPLLESVRIQKEFITDVSHELRTPIAAIQTACEVALRSDKKTPEDYKKVIQQTYNEIVRLKKMTEDLLSLSKKEALIEAPVLTEHSLGKIVHDTVEEMKPLIEDKKLVLIEETADVSILCSRDGIKQLILILLDNAVKYSETGGRITVTVVSHLKPQLIIADTGIGIPQSIQEKIFERKFRGTDISLGSGIGLTIAKYITDAHKATIAVDSEQGKGSSFIVTFP